MSSLGLDAAEQHVGAQRLLQHRAAFQPAGVTRLAAGLPMRHGAGEVSAGGIAAFGDAPERRAGELRQCRRQRAQVGELRMTQRQRAEPHRAPLAPSSAAPRRDAPRSRCAAATAAARCAGTAAPVGGRDRRQHRRQVRHLSPRGGNEVRCTGKL